MAPSPFVQASPQALPSVLPFVNLQLPAERAEGLHNELHPQVGTVEKSFQQIPGDMLRPGSMPVVGQASPMFRPAAQQRVDPAPRTPPPPPPGPQNSKLKRQPLPGGGAWESKLFGTEPSLTQVGSPRQIPPVLQTSAGLRSDSWTETASAECLTPWHHRVPIALFSVPMAMGMVGLAWQRANTALPSQDVPKVIGDIILVLSALGWAVLFLLWVLKAAVARDEIAAEFVHPTSSHLFAVPSIALIIFSAGCVAPVDSAKSEGDLTLDTAWDIGRALAALGVAGHVLMSLVTLRRHLLRPSPLLHMTPASLLLPTGLLLVGLPTGVLHESWREVGIGCWTAGVFFWVVLSATMLLGSAADEGVDEHLRSSFAALLVPPAVAASAHGSLIAGADGVTRGLCYFSLLLVLLMVSLLKSLWKGSSMRHAAVWWSGVFGAGSVALAVAMVGGDSPSVFWQVITWVTLLTASVLMLAAYFSLVASCLRGDVFGSYLLALPSQPPAATKPSGGESPSDGVEANGTPRPRHDRRANRLRRRRRETHESGDGEEPQDEEMDTEMDEMDINVEASLRPSGFRMGIKKKPAQPAA
eukprot:CAMPEP_0114543646 /NCGR_PEP_ID=MMETSP0114-20121206/2465_1 /TAXON_ID=31324 /ORGANISM="Goniomonas sp, Strain m" /LENGTH=584 /DNA_ID=CAMNT_0001727995 /DNA_START=213 /DNA_END=1967 /DNA_ORIENTATION=-